MANLRSLDFPGTVHLPVGLWVEGTRQRDVSIGPLTGRDEELIADASHWPSPAARVSALLAATILQIGLLTPVGLEDVRALTVLDRDVLMMALRQRLFGERIQSTVRCPHEGCGKLVDIDFHLGDLPLPQRPDPEPRLEVNVDGTMITGRLPNGGDQEAVAEAARDDPDKAGRVILQRCIEHLDLLSDEQVAGLQEEIARRDPQLDTDFDAHCPECGNDFTVHFDIQDFLLGEISTAGRQLYRQVHTLAWYYHWSEAEIMAMPLQKRRVYLDLLSDAVSELGEIDA